MEKSMPVKENLLLIFPKKRGHATPCRATENAFGFSQEAESGAREKPRPEP